MQIITLKNEHRQLIQTKSPNTILYLQSGEYEFTAQIKATAEQLWDISEYTGELVLEVYNG